MTKDILVGMILGGIITGFFLAFGKYLFNYIKNKVSSIFSKSKLTNENLKNKTLSLYEDIMGFLRERTSNEPQVNSNNWTESTNNLIKYSKETMNLYDENFGAKVEIIRQEYLKRGIKSDRLNQFYKHPTNPLGIREVGYGLTELAGKLIKKNANH